MGPRAGSHGGWDTVLCQYLPMAGVAGRLRFFNVYGCRFADLGLVVVCYSV